MTHRKESIQEGKSRYQNKKTGKNGKKSAVREREPEDEKTKEINWC